MRAPAQGRRNGETSKPDLALVLVLFLVAGGVPCCCAEDAARHAHAHVDCASSCAEAPASAEIQRAHGRLPLVLALVLLVLLERPLRDTSGSPAGTLMAVERLSESRESLCVGA